VETPKKRRTALVGLALTGLTLAFCLIYNERSFIDRAETYDLALAQTAAWEIRLTDILSIKGKINGVTESVSQDSPASIEEAVLRLETAPADMTAIPVSPRLKLNAGIQQIASAARKGQPQVVAKTSAEISPLLIKLEQQLVASRRGSEIERLRAFTSMNRMKNLEVAALLAFGFALAGFFAMSWRSLREWIGQTHPQPAVATQRGFTLVEVVMVAAITMVLSTIAIANISAVVSSARIHAGISSMSGLLQNTRMLAVKKNKTMTAHVDAEGSGALVGYIKVASDTSAKTSKDPQVEWESPVIRMSELDGPGAPDALTIDQLAFTPQSGDISYNSRGLPCEYSGGVCTGAGFLYYFKDTSREGNKGWAALSISPAGKITKWFWNNTNWNH
jgi:prepilin-type N-terminal cleavage/methylation domain-containing protein